MSLDERRCPFAGGERLRGLPASYALGLCHAQINEIEGRDYATDNECHIYMLKKHMFRSLITVITLHFEVN